MMHKDAHGMATADATMMRDAGEKFMLSLVYFANFRGKEATNICHTKLMLG